LDKTIDFPILLCVYPPILGVLALSLLLLFHMSNIYKIQYINNTEPEKANLLGHLIGRMVFC